MNIKTDITELVGHTPLFECRNFSAKYNLTARILCKLEYLNPAGSVKDRTALFMIKDAEEKGLLHEGSVIVEPTSGNTGIGLAAIAASRGYRVILTMPETMSAERRKLLAAYGAEIVLTSGNLGMKGAIAEAEKIAAATNGSFIPAQFDNPANALAHENTTAPEIYQDCDGNIDAFIAGIGTGGTITGSARYFKSKSGNIKIIGVEPDTSPLLTKGYAGAHKLQGIGANFIPKVLDITLIDEVLAISADDAFDAARTLAKSEGILVGITSGAALAAAKILAERPEYAGKTIVVLLPDTGDRYLSTELFN